MGEAKKRNDFSLISGYMNDDCRRHALNKLAQTTFKLNFEEWYKNGYCGNQYVPYSLWDNDEIIANISANIMNFKLFGKHKNYIQIGTVMTDKAHRNKGAGKYLMEKIIEDYLEHSDGLYLFANDKAKGFYEKLGFTEAKQYQYVKHVQIAEHAQASSSVREEKNTFIKVGKEETILKTKYLNDLKQAKDNSSFVMDNYGLMTFWTADMEDIYYSVGLDCFISAQTEDNVLFLNSITSSKDIKITEITKYLDIEIQKIILGFVPPMNEIDDFEAEVYTKENDTLFFMGKEIGKDLAENKLMFPVYSHA